MLENIRSIAVCVAFAATLPTPARGAAVKVVGNSWISLMAYQARGRSYISP